MRLKLNLNNTKFKEAILTVHLWAGLTIFKIMSFTYYLNDIEKKTKLCFDIYR